MVNSEIVRSWLDEIPDPEMPAVSITDLGIVRDVRLADDGVLEVALTPTYSGCPATQAIREDVARTLEEHGIRPARIVVQLSPAWTTDWITARGRKRLQRYGIAPPHKAPIEGPPLENGPVVLSIKCPHCGSPDTREQSHFGSTPCKALHRCNNCREPFDYVKPH